LCTVLIQNPNFLILDEPTNDLDIVTLNVLENFLLDFPGCLLVVSHDRYFMDKIVDHLFVFRGEGKVEDFPGNYSDFRTYEDSTPVATEPKKLTVLKAHTTSQSDTKLSFNEQKELKNLESKLKSLEFDKKEIEAKFLVPDIDMDTINSLSEDLKALNQVIEDKELRWLELNEKLN
jgi:ATP-binding cassette subfamily F protein uup